MKAPMIQSCLWPMEVRRPSIDENFQEALEYVCSQLARMIAKDGEGATKLMEVEVNGSIHN